MSGTEVDASDANPISVAPVHVGGVPFARGMLVVMTCSARVVAIVTNQYVYNGQAAVPTNLDLVWNRLLDLGDHVGFC